MKPYLNEHNALGVILSQELERPYLFCTYRLTAVDAMNNVQSIKLRPFIKRMNEVELTRYLHQRWLPFEGSVFMFSGKEQGRKFLYLSAVNRNWAALWQEAAGGDFLLLCPFVKVIESVWRESQDYVQRPARLPLVDLLVILRSIRGETDGLEKMLISPFPSDAILHRINKL